MLSIFIRSGYLWKLERNCGESRLLTFHHCLMKSGLKESICQFISAYDCFNWCNMYFPRYLFLLFKQYIYSYISSEYQLELCISRSNEQMGWGWTIEGWQCSSLWSFCWCYVRTFRLRVWRMSTTNSIP